MKEANQGGNTRRGGRADDDDNVDDNDNDADNDGDDTNDADFDGKWLPYPCVKRGPSSLDWTHNSRLDFIYHTDFSAFSLSDKLNTGLHIFCHPTYHFC